MLTLYTCIPSHRGIGEDTAERGVGIAVGQGTGRGGIGGTPGTIKALVAVMVVSDWVAAGSCG